MRLVHWRGPAPTQSLRNELSQAGIEVRTSSDAAEATPLVLIRTLGKEVPRAPKRGAWVWLPTSSPGSEAEARAVLAGAVDVIALDDVDATRKLIARVDEAYVEEAAPPRDVGFVAESEAARRVLREILRAAQTSMPVLLTGETGTGKELAARLLHAWSRRKDKLFVPVCCAAIPNDLIEAELFGYVRGAFSGAVRDYPGQLAAAEGGSVFLDEIDDTPPTLQTKLLRVLEDRVVSQLGKNEWRRVDFRIVAATNRDLEALIARREFGQDLYERLAILQVKLPPLRERREDLPALAAHFVERFHGEEPPAPGRVRVRSVSARALAALSEYNWPGNVRELRNTIYESLVGKVRGEELLLSDLPRRILERHRAAQRGDELVDPLKLAARFDSRSMNLREELERLERSALVEALRRTHGNPARAARLLGEVGRGKSRDPAGTVRAMMRRLGVTSDRDAS